MDMKEWVAGVEKKLAEHGVAATDIAEIKGRMDELEQRAARRGKDGAAPLSIGRQFAEKKAGDIASVREHRGRVSMAFKTTITSAGNSAGSLIVPHRDEALPMPRRRLTIRDLMTVITVESGSVEYARQTARSSAAGMVAEGTAKPESAIAFELATAPIRTIAHWVPASRQVLDDAPQLAGIIDSDLRYGLAIKEEDQLLFGDGTGANVSGMVPAATAFAAPFSISSPTMIDNVGLAVLQAALTDVPPDGIVLNPSDWWRMRLTKDADGKYILGDPAANVEPRLFGLPVVPTPAMTVDKFLVGGFTPQTLYDRWEARVEVSTEHADFFTKNLVAILAEERIGTAIKRPSALIYGDFGNVA